MRKRTNNLWNKVWAIVLIAVLLPTICFAMIGCGGGEEDDPKPDPKPVVNPTVLETPHNIIIPKPVGYASATGKYTLASDSAIGYSVADSKQSADVGNVAAYLAEKLKAATGYAFAVSAASGTPSTAIKLTTIPTTEPISGSDDYSVYGDEGYVINVNGSGILVKAYAAEGLFRGIQTVRQMLPAEIEKSEVVDNAQWNIEFAEVKDYPRYEFRSVMIDVARHFFTKEEIMRQIDIIAGFKMNTLHLHLSDDQGFRIAFDGYEELTDFGGITKDIMQKKYTTKAEGLATTFPPGSPYYGKSGYYTKEDFKEIVAYAKERYIQVIPEVEFPSHNAALLLAIPSLCKGGDIPDAYLDKMYGSDVGYGVTQNPNTHAATKKVIDDIIDQLVEMTESEYIHIGGDEAHDMSTADYNTVTQYLLDEVEAKGKKTIEWMASDANTVAHPYPDVLQNWSSNNKHYDYTAKAVAAGSKVIASFANRAYFDHYVSAGVPIGISWARTGGVPLNVAYQWDPEEAVPSSYRDKGNVLGLECALFTETVGDEVGLDMLLYPKLLGYAEIAWSPKEKRYDGMVSSGDWKNGTPKSTAAWEDYKGRLSYHGKRLSYRGISIMNHADVWGEVDIDISKHKYNVNTPVNEPVSGQIAYTVGATDTVDIKMFGDPTQGQVTVNNDGSWRYVPNRNFVGTDSFTLAFGVNDLGIPMDSDWDSTKTTYTDNRLELDFKGVVTVTVNVTNSGGSITASGTVDAIHDRNIVVKFDVPVPGLEKTDFTIANSTVRFAKTYDNGSTYLLVTAARTKGTDYSMTVKKTGYTIGTITCKY